MLHHTKSKQNWFGRVLDSFASRATPEVSPYDEYYDFTFAPPESYLSVGNRRIKKKAYSRMR